MNIGTLFVSLVADPSGITKGTNKGIQELSRLEGAVKRVGLVLAGAFTAKALLNFGRDSVQAFAEAEGIWARLATAVDDTGTSFAKVGGQINAAAVAMQNASRFSDEEFAKALQNLVVQTGNVGQSLGMMGLAADLATARQVPLEEATQLLGKALAGNTTQLTKMFPALKNSTNLLGDLQKLVKGMAEKDVTTLEGRLSQLTNAWDNFKEAIGGALTGSDSMSGSVVKLTGFVQDLTKFVDENRAAIQLLVSPLTIAAASFQFFVGGGVKGLQLLIDKWKEWRGLTEAAVPAAAALVPTPPPLVVAGTGAAGAAKVAKVWTDLAAAMKSATTVSNLLRDATQGVQGQIEQASASVQTQIDLQRSALEDLVKLGVNPASKAVQELVRNINLLKASQGVEIMSGSVAGPEVTFVSSFFSKLVDALKGVGQDWKAVVTGGSGAGGADVLGNVLGQLSGAFDSLMATLGPMAIVGEFLNGVFSALAPVLDALMVPIRDIGVLVGSVIAPVLKLLQPILDGVAKGFSFVIQANGMFLKGLGKFINWLLPGNPANGLVSFGQNMIDMAKETRRAIDAGVDMTKTMDKITSSASNVPAIFDLLARRRDAGQDFTIPSSARTAQPRGLTVNVNNPPAGVDPVALARQVARAVTELARQGRNTEFALAVEGALE